MYSTSFTRLCWEVSLGCHCEQQDHLWMDQTDRCSEFKQVCVSGQNILGIYRQSAKVLCYYSCQTIIGEGFDGGYRTCILEEEKENILGEEKEKIQFCYRELCYREQPVASFQCHVLCQLKESGCVLPASSCSISNSRPSR